MIDKLVACLDAALNDRGYLAMGGSIIDATMLPAPKQGNTEKAKVRQIERSPPQHGTSPVREHKWERVKIERKP